MVNVRVISHGRHSRKGRLHTVSSYNQFRKSKRGVKGNVIRRPNVNVMDTYWLMDKRGNFIGRANRRGETTAKGIWKQGKDDTGNMQEKKTYGRIYGRYPASWSRWNKKNKES